MASRSSSSALDALEAAQRQERIARHHYNQVMRRKASAPRDTGIHLSEATCAIIEEMYTEARQKTAACQSAYDAVRTP